MKTLTWLSLVIFLIAMLAGGTALAPARVAAQAKPVVWNLPHVAAPTYYHTINLNAFAAKVKEKSQGRMEIRVHPASSLYPPLEIIPAVVAGRAEIGPVLSAYLTDLMLEMGVLELPFITSNLDEHRKAAEQLRPFFIEAMAKKGLKLLTIHTWPTQQMFSNTPLRTLGDWKGKKLNLFVIQGLLPGSSARAVTRGTTPFVVLMVLLVAVLFFFPALALWLPRTMQGR